MFMEGIGQATQQLRSNKLRTFLSLLGITIGIFCIIAVRSAVSSLESNIRESFEKLGNDVLYISKMPWAENPHENYWKYFKRPNPDIDDLSRIITRSENTEMGALSVFLGGKVVKFGSSHVDGGFVIAATYHYADILNVEMEEGRWMTDFEYQSGKNNVILGNTVAEELFPKLHPIGKEVRISGQNFKVIGVITKSGNDIINPVNFDNAVIIGYNTAKKIANVKTKHMFGTSLMVKAKR
jgi:putative ABC transport system permease protein